MTTTSTSTSTYTDPIPRSVAEVDALAAADILACAFRVDAATRRPVRITSTWTRRTDGRVTLRVQHWGAYGVRETKTTDCASTGAAWAWLAATGAIGDDVAADRGAFLAWLQLARVDAGAGRG